MYPQDGYATARYDTGRYDTGRYDTARGERTVPPIFNSNQFGYDSQTWNAYATTNNAGPIGATSRSRSTARRQALPQVSELETKLEIVVLTRAGLD